ncbi:hypothetical protein TRFO_39045 [Tritrichomonas foetus]|uniref:Uncharacterized protein n=1 Tax=Tritrichomonas foetus TaxID=1144522 RepID=A0A1J4J6C3_9EUKA|nr:hypothetical protein TRFO_39045 [Tritrichomonas foetus]|eukprot:OHS94786.1 hypothetical protein TRFO_39045 [Tritrichomonas foetus]
MNFCYKDTELTSSVNKKTAFINLVSDHFSTSSFEQWDPHLETRPIIMNVNEFQNLLDHGAHEFLNNNLEEVNNILLHLYDIFVIPDIDLKNYSELFQTSFFCSRILLYLKEESYLPIVPFFVQLCIEIIAHGNNPSFCSYIEGSYSIIETLMVVRNRYFYIPKYKDVIPLISLLCYNIYYFYGENIVNQTTEIYALQQLFLEEQNEPYIFLPMINILRNLSISDDSTNRNFFEFIKIANDHENPQVVEYSMWCLYFWFKNSWNYAASFIKKEFVKPLSKKIKEPENEIILTIALYIYSYLWFVEDDEQNLLVSQCFPYENVLQLIFHSNSEIVSLVLVNINNCISISHFYMSFFISKGIIPYILQYAQEGQINVKNEAGYLLATIFSNARNGEIDEFKNVKVLSILCELCTIDDKDLIFVMIETFLRFIQEDQGIIQLFLSLDFQNELTFLSEQYNESEIGEMIDRLLTIVSQFIQQQE